MKIRVEAPSSFCAAIRFDDVVKSMSSTVNGSTKRKLVTRNGACITLDSASKMLLEVAKRVK